MLLQFRRSATSASMASGEGMQSDIESDEEFEELTSDELFTFHSEDFVLNLVRQALNIQLSEKRLYRVEKILEALFADPSRFSSTFEDLDTDLWEAFMHMPIRELPEFLVRIIFRYARGQGFPLCSCLKTFAVTKAVLFEDNDSLDTLRKTLGHRFVNQVVADQQERLRSRSELLSASLRGDLAEVDRLLIELPGLCSSQYGWPWYKSVLWFGCNDLDPITAAAELGHTAVVSRLFASSEKESQCLVFETGGLWSIACRRSNLEMAANLLSMTDITWYIREERACTLCDCIEGTPEFFRGALSMIRACLGDAGLELYADWLREMLDFAILLRRRHHVAIFLDEIDQDTSLFNEYPWNMQSILQVRSAALLRDVLIRYPEAPGHIPDCDPLLAIQDYHWPVGARLLVEAGAKIQGKVPSNFAELLSLSLEDRCRIVVRRHMKFPLSQSVGRLPLPGKAIRRLLYC